ncbi:related to Phosphopantothenoylcysteine decarboxylase [Ustilago trichophora]|uniref:Related to Phosphopantothenoylcysteine decarboxylase n=1 Tax=Ustilago trichophora TaxID=86804 RepID=A0A5C3ERU6_9BASI|nr:related to Phosphopantothenoylcysteine decarboxylase [Ustilago trichophora]
MQSKTPSSTESNSKTTTSIPPSLSSPHPSLSRPPIADRPLHIVLASTGSVASVKIPHIVEELLKYANVRIQIIASDNSLHFYDRQFVLSLNTNSSSTVPYTVASLAAENSSPSSSSSSSSSCSGAKPRVHLWTNSDEWTTFTRIGDPILHIELRRWADLIIIAPCSANTLAKLNAGICDDLLTSFMRALGNEQQVWLAPAMNTAMWMHPLTERHVGFVKEALGYKVLGPVQKKLACGDTGLGAMVEWSVLVHDVVEKYGLMKVEKIT